MTRGKCYLLLLMVCLLTACGSDDDYDYPSVKLEYLTAFAGADGSLQSILTDEGKTYTVVEDATNTQVEANKSLRIVSNYADVVAADGAVGVKLYAALKAVSPLPVTAVKFKDGVVTDPADILSIWMGLNYLNVTLQIKAQKEKHQFGFIEDEVATDVSAGHRDVYLTLYHNANKDVQAYTQRAYLSVPLQQYATNGIKKVAVHFSLHTYSGEIATYTFDYTPAP